MRFVRARVSLDRHATNIVSITPLAAHTDQPDVVVGGSAHGAHTLPREIAESVRSPPRSSPVPRSSVEGPGVETGTSFKDAGEASGCFRGCRRG